MGKVAYTFQEMLDELRKLDETSLVEILDLTTEDLVDILMDRIEDRQELIRKELDLE